MEVHKLAAAKRRKRRPNINGPVVKVTVDRLLWRYARAAIIGEDRHLVIVDAETVIVRNGARNGR
jgi:hypothetical protein